MASAQMTYEELEDELCVVKSKMRETRRKFRILERLGIGYENSVEEIEKRVDEILSIINSEKVIRED